MKRMFSKWCGKDVIILWKYWLLLFFFLCFNGMFFFVVFFSPHTMFVFPPLVGVKKISIIHFLELNYSVFPSNSYITLLYVWQRFMQVMQFDSASCKNSVRAKFRQIVFFHPKWLYYMTYIVCDKIFQFNPVFRLTVCHSLCSEHL